MEITVPDAKTLESMNDLAAEDLPEIARITQELHTPEVSDVGNETIKALKNISMLKDLSAGSTIAVTAGSRGIPDMPEVIETTVKWLQDQNYVPFVMPAMGSHGGATPKGQREVLNDYGITEDRLGCEIRASMDVESIATDTSDRPIPVSRVALDADAVILANRIKVHTDFNHKTESGLLKMAVVGLGKQRGAEEMHNAAIQHGLGCVIPERAQAILNEVPIIGGLALVENSNERTAAIEGIEAKDIINRESELLTQSKEYLPELPMNDLDILIVDEIGKDISGTSMDTNVIGRYRFLDEPEPSNPSIGRIYARKITHASHGNGLGMGLADFVHKDLINDLNLGDTYLNTATSGEPKRSFIPIIVPSDRTALILAYSMTGVQNPENLRIGYIKNTLEPNRIFVSKPVLSDVHDRDSVEVGPLHSIPFDSEGNLELEFNE